ncbi:FAD binding domain-containing protein [Deltaproteobacteria bacterium OttesenSCG-928-M10]|nr:FAD binding domain-containing protein [Deltaproteobacteria bacterium OttesenSCG-928-M10]
MKPFTHIKVHSVDQAAQALRDYKGRAVLMAGGTDLMGCLKDRLWLEPPQAVIDLKNISSLCGIVPSPDGLSIGALTTLTEIAESEPIISRYLALARAAARTASPLLRNMGTISGNICQENRCWYYRYPHKLGGLIPCVRKGGDKCLAVPGDSRYHSIFGAVNKCIAVNPGDTAPALIALAATAVTNKRKIPLDEFFAADRGKQSTVLEADEMVTALELPARTAAGDSSDCRSAFKKLAFRRSIDFAIVNCAAWLKIDDGLVAEARICLNGVYNNPVRAEASEQFLIGAPLTAEAAAQAALLAVERSKPLPSNAYKVPMVQAMVEDCLIGCLPAND